MRATKCDLGVEQRRGTLIASLFFILTSVYNCLFASDPLDYRMIFPSLLLEGFKHARRFIGMSCNINAFISNLQLVGWKGQRRAASTWYTTVGALTKAH